jgi:tRNA(Ile)-lysidine synthase
MLENLELFFEQECSSLDLDPILVGVSGGSDSLCLLDLLARTGRNVLVAHFNHQLRPESDREMEQVRELAQNYGLPFVSASQDVKRFATDYHFSLEEAARKLRYRFLFKQAREAGAQVIAVAHHADDQIETVLMHFLRGAGLSGLKGMAAVTILPEFDANIRLVRPLLRTWRIEIEAYCREHNLEPLEDQSNADTTYFRNRLRHQLIPELEGYNPGFKQVLLRSAESLGGDFQLLHEVLEDFWTRTVVETGPGYLVFDLRNLQGASPAMLRNIFRRAVVHLNSDLRDVNFEAVERLVRFVRQVPSPGRQVDFTDGNHVFTEAGKFFISRRSAEIPSPQWPSIQQQIHVNIGHPLKLDVNWQLIIQEEPVPANLETIFSNEDPFQAWMDADRVQGTLQVRSRKDGDRFQPLGMPKGSLKLSDFFINEKLPSRGRTNWPLVCLGDEIIWIPGYRSAHPYRVTGSTRRLLHFSLYRVNS